MLCAKVGALWISAVTVTVPPVVVCLVVDTVTALLVGAVVAAVSFCIDGGALVSMSSSSALVDSGSALVFPPFGFLADFVASSFRRFSWS